MITLTRRPKTEQPTSEQRFVLHDMSWAFYEALLNEIGDRHIFVTFDRGELEIMAPSQGHDLGKKFTARLLESMTFELGIDVICLGSTTWKRKDLARGLEPDECYYIKNEALVINKLIDLTRDPPPDLALEVEITHSLLDRVAIYAALGVPELWRYDGKHLRFYHLQPSGTYRLSPKSLNFPFLASREMERFIKMRESMKENHVLRLFLAWIRDNAHK